MSTNKDLEEWREAFAAFRKAQLESERKVKSFVYLGASTLSKLNDGIKEHIEKCYLPHGELIIDNQFIQAMVLYEAPTSK